MCEQHSRVRLSSQSFVVGRTPWPQGLGDIGHLFGCLFYAKSMSDTMLISLGHLHVSHRNLGYAMRYPDPGGAMGLLKFARNAEP